ncbi:hypothetical protein VSDG_09752 [Cytospora chrysosperma]|uniref:Uncharacterized protein n=1 Tax=Cytospora chrysosperma TaxID=252740 RepID=A0A423V9Y8_CYTCH|nr:hypothetical protein VSDG_09752 [Valsa sordida]
MAPSTLDQFIRFGTDAAGIERILRMVQAFLAVVMSQPVLTHNLAMLVALGNRHVWEEPRVLHAGVLSDLIRQLATSRRFFRMFRFLECFRAANTLYASLYSGSPAQASTPPASSPSPAAGPDTVQEGDHDPSPSPPAPAAATTTHPTSKAGPSPDANPHPQPHQHQHQQQPTAEAWLAIFARAFNGMYLLLEALTLVDALGFPLWGPRWAATLHVEGQRFWLFALACGAAGGMAATARLLCCAPPLPAVPGDWACYGGRGGGGGGGEEEVSKDVAAAGGGGRAAAMADWEVERERLRRVMWPRREQRRIWRADIRGKWWGLVRRCVADSLDMAAPASVVGWVRIDPGTVGAVQVVTTYLTGMEIWESSVAFIQAVVPTPRFSPWAAHHLLTSVWSPRASSSASSMSIMRYSTFLARRPSMPGSSACAYRSHQSSTPMWLYSVGSVRMAQSKLSLSSPLSCRHSSRMPTCPYRDATLHTCSSCPNVKPDASHHRIASGRPYCAAARIDLPGLSSISAGFWRYASRHHSSTWMWPLADACSSAAAVYFRGSPDRRHHSRTCT